MLHSFPSVLNGDKGYHFKRKIIFAYIVYYLKCLQDPIVFFTLFMFFLEIYLYGLQQLKNKVFFIYTMNTQGVSQLSHDIFPGDRGRTFVPGLWRNRPFWVWNEVTKCRNRPFSNVHCEHIFQPNFIISGSLDRYWALLNSIIKKSRNGRFRQSSGTKVVRVDVLYHLVKYRARVVKHLV